MRTWKIVLGVALMSLPAALPAQWAHYGGSGRPHSLLDASEGGWVIAGETKILKLSASGAVVWGLTLGSGQNYIYSIKAWPSPDGGVVVAGYSDPVWVLLKLSAAGSVEWQKRYALDGAMIEAFIPMPDGGTVMAGQLGSDLLLCRCSPGGEIEWQMSVGTAGDDLLAAAAATADGGIVILSSSGPGEGGYPMTGLWVLKLDAEGVVEWQKLIGGAFDDVGECVFQTGDGGYLIAGHSASFADDVLSRFWLLKLSPAGEILRQQTLDHEYVGLGWFSMRRAEDGSFVAAISSSFQGRPGCTVVATILEDGTVAREAAYSLAGPVYAMMPSEDGGSLLSIQEDGDAHVMRLLPSGEIEWQRTYGSLYSDDTIDHLRSSGDGGYILAGKTDSWGGFTGLNSLWIMRTAPDGSIGPNCYFIGEADASRLEDIATRTNVAAAVEDTAAVPQSAGLAAAAGAFDVVSWGPTTLPSLGGAVSTLTVKRTIIRDGPFTGEGTDLGTVTPGLGSHTYAAGTSVNIGCTVNEGYTFLNWSGNIRLEQRSATIIMDGDKLIDLWLEYSGKGAEKLPNASCFIATAAYADPGHPDVEVLRRFRDRYLMKSRAGRAFVKLYYRYSPPLAEFVDERPALRAVSRAVLSPVVAACRFLLGL